MKNLNDCYKKCAAILDSLNIPYDKYVGDYISVNNRLRRPMAQTTKTVGYYATIYKIEFNPAMLLDSVPDYELEDTMLHELLHTCPDCWCHTGKWKRYAEIVNHAYGYHISRTGYSPECTARRDEIEPYKYELLCKKCGKHVAYRKRKCDLTEFPGLYTHRNCGGDLRCVEI